MVYFAEVHWRRYQEKYNQRAGHTFRTKNIPKTWYKYFLFKKLVAPTHQGSKTSQSQLNNSKSEQWQKLHQQCECKDNKGSSQPTCWPSRNRGVTVSQSPTDQLSFWAASQRYNCCTAIVYAYGSRRTRTIAPFKLW